MTKQNIINSLRTTGWKRIKWRWYNPKHPVGKTGVTLREAASLQCLDSCEDLSEGPQHEAMKELGIDPWKLANQIEPWLKACQWHGAPKLKQLCAKAGFNVNLLILHLECMVKRLKSNH